MVYTCQYESPLGGILLAADEIGLTGLWFDGEKYFADHLPPEHTARETPILTETKRWLDIYFKGREPDFMPPLHPIGSTFRQDVWEILLQIPYGQTTTYGEIARQLASKRGLARMSAQAVGGAVGHNEISIIIPCHRVVGTNGSLTGYAGGIHKKAKLLELEHTDMSRFFVPKKVLRFHGGRKMIVASATQKMIEFYKENLHDIEHFLKVWAMAKTIGELEALDSHTQKILELAAVVHDIACPLCREKYGDTNGKHQELESPPLVEAFFAELPVGRSDVDRISWLVAHHHTYTNVDGLDHQILLEADFLVNAGESSYTRSAIENFRRCVFRTVAGTRLLDSIYLKGVNHI